MHKENSHKQKEVYLSFLTKDEEVGEGAQSFGTPRYAFWAIDFKLAFKKQKTPQNPLTFPLTA